MDLEGLIVVEAMIVWFGAVSSIETTYTTNVFEGFLVGFFRMGVFLLCKNKEDY